MSKIKNAELIYPQQKQSRKSKILVVAALLTMMAIAVLLSLLVFSKTSLRLDEAQSLFQTNRDVGGMLFAVAQDVHVPFYHILLHFWQKIFGGEIDIARLMSLVFYVGSIPATYLLGRYAFNRRVGLFAALLLTLSPFMNWYGSEARMYTMLVFMVIVHQLFFLKIYREGKRMHWTMYTLTAIAGLYTHYFFAFVLLTEALFFFIKRKSFISKRTFLKFLLSAVTIAIALAPWLYYVYSLGTASNTRPSLPVPSSGDLFNTYAQFIFGFQIDYFNTIIVSLWPIVVLLAFFALQKSRIVPPQAIFFVMAAIVPVLGAYLVSITIQPFYLSRYLIVSIPALFIFISWVFTNYPKKLRYWLKSLLLLFITLTLIIQIVSPNTPVKENYKDAVAYLSKEATPQDVIVVTAPFTIYPVEYYYKGDAKLTTQPIWDRFSEGAIPAFDPETVAEETKELTKSYKTVWLILSYDQGYNEDIFDYYEGNYERLSEENFSPELNVYSYKLRYDRPLTITPIKES